MTIFTKRDKPVAEPAPVSEAEARGIRPPPLTKEHKAGIEAAAAINQRKSDKRLEEYERERRARRQAAEDHDAWLWSKVVERNRHAIG
jgi:hypothetical protein